MNRKVEGIGNIIAITTARMKADAEALRSLGASLEAITFDEHDLMSLEEWGNAKDLAQRARENGVDCLRALGVLPPFVPRPGAFGAGVLKAPEPREKVRRPNVQRHRGGTQRGSGKVVQEHGKPSESRTTARHEKENPE